VSLRELLRIAAGALLAQRGRSALTVLSITIGAFTIVVMSSLAASGLATLERGIEELGGARLLLFFNKLPERGEAKADAYARGISLVDRDRVFRDLPHVESVSLFSRFRKQEVLSEDGLRVSTDLVAGDARFFEAFQMKVARGRAFSEEENRSREAVCVIGHKLVKKLGERDLLGRSLTIGPLRCHVIGILANNERHGVGFGFDWTDLAIVPVETLANLDPTARDRGTVLVKTDSPGANDIVKRIVNARLVARHPGVDDFAFIDFSGVMERFRAIFAIMELIVALLAGIALLIGGVGVMNMMLVTVSERKAEIGLRKALGATPRSIRGQFLLEAVVLALAGGSAGVVAGLGVSSLAGFAIAHFLPTWQLSLAPIAAAAALAVSVTIGGTFGWLPARGAARLDPIVSLRG
jgi:putative ABC transport system permease protein